MIKTNELVKTITKGIQEKKGSGIVIADLGNIDGAIARYFVICQGNSRSRIGNRPMGGDGLQRCDGTHLLA